MGGREIYMFRPIGVKIKKYNEFDGVGWGGMWDTSSSNTRLARSHVCSIYICTMYWHCRHHTKIQRLAAFGGVVLLPQKDNN